MTDIYEQHDKHFSHVQSFAILDKDCNFVAKIAIKFPASGEGRLYAYVHWIGLQMVRGHATGYGYDKKSAAMSTAAAHLKPPAQGPVVSFELFRAALAHDNGMTWDRHLRDAGFTVLQTI